MPSKDAIYGIGLGTGLVLGVVLTIAVAGVALLEALLGKLPP